MGPWSNHSSIEGTGGKRGGMAGENTLVFPGEENSLRRSSHQYEPADESPPLKEGAGYIPDQSGARASQTIAHPEK